MIAFYHSIKTAPLEEIILTIYMKFQTVRKYTYQTLTSQQFWLLFIHSSIYSFYILYSCTNIIVIKILTKDSFSSTTLHSNELVDRCNLFSNTEYRQPHRCQHQRQKANSPMILQHNLSPGISTCTGSLTLIFDITPVSATYQRLCSNQQWRFNVPPKTYVTKEWSSLMAL